MGPWVGKKAYILKYLVDFKNNLINIGYATLYHLSMMYITVYNLSINSNHRILAEELNYRFTKIVNSFPEVKQLRVLTVHEGHMGHYHH